MQGRKVLVVMIALACVALGVFWEQVLSAPRQAMNERAHQTEFKGRLPENDLDDRAEFDRNFDELSRQHQPAPATPGLAAVTDQAPVETGNREYRVVSGDNPARIARKVYGQSSLAHLILQANPDVQATRLQIGQVLRIPPLAAPAAQTGSALTPATKPPQGAVVYEIRPGDKLSLIAKKYYKTPSKWPLIVSANPGLDPNRLQPGQEIIIPPLR